MCVCVDYFSCSKINEVQVRVSSHVFLACNGWICKISFVLELCLVLLTWNAIAAFSEESVAKFVHQVLLLYLVASSALER